MALEIQSLVYPLGSGGLEEALSYLDGSGLNFSEVSVRGNSVQAIVFSANGSERELILNPSLGIMAKVRETESVDSGQADFGGALLQKVIPFGELELGLEYRPGDVRHPGANFARKIKKSCYGHVRNYWAADNKALDFWGAGGLVDPERYGEPSDKLYLLTQVKPDTGEFDEYKLMVGYPSISKAVQAYLEEMPEAYLGGIKSVTYEDLALYRRNKAPAEFKSGRPHRCTEKSTPCKGRCIPKGRNCREPVSAAVKSGARLLEQMGGKAGKAAPKEQPKEQAKGKTLKPGETHNGLRSAEKELATSQRFKVGSRKVDVSLEWEGKNGGLGTLTLTTSVNGDPDAPRRFRRSERVMVAREVDRRAREMISKLPDGTVVESFPYNGDDKEDRRGRLLARRGFSYDPESSTARGIVRNGKLEPLPFEDYFQRTRDLKPHD